MEAGGWVLLVELEMAAVTMHQEGRVATQKWARAEVGEEGQWTAVVADWGQAAEVLEAGAAAEAGSVTGADWG